MYSNFSPRSYSCLAMALTMAAIAAPAAESRHGPGEDPATTSPRHPQLTAAAKGSAPTRWNASPLEIDRLGAKYVSLYHPMFAAPVEADWPGPTAAGTAIANARHDAMPVSAVKVVSPSAFDWSDAGIGAGVASLTLALVAMLVMLVTRRSRRTIAPKRSELAGT